MKISETIVGIGMCILLALGTLSIPMLPSGNVAQAAAQAVGPMGSPLPTPPPSGGCVARASANIRRGPSVRYRIIGRLPRGASFKLTRRSGSWVSGTSRYGSGWVLRSLLRCS